MQSLGDKGTGATYATAGNLQIKSDGSINGRNYFWFDGIDDYIRGADALSINGKMTLFLVLRLQASQKCCHGVFSLVPDDGKEDFRSQQSFAIDMELKYLSGWLGNSDYFSTSTIPAAATNEWVVFCYTVSSDQNNDYTVQVQKNREDTRAFQKGGVQFQPNQNGFIVGSRWPVSNEFGRFDLAEATLFGRSLGDVSRSAVMNELLATYGIGKAYHATPHQRRTSAAPVPSHATPCLATQCNITLCKATSRRAAPRTPYSPCLMAQSP